MRKLVFIAFMVASGFTVFAQNLEDVQEKISKGKYGEAREKIDKILADSKGQKNANAWYWKAVTYYGLSADSTLTDKNYLKESYDAIVKYYEMDPKNLLGTLEQNLTILKIYDSYYNAGIKTFNNKNFDNSFKAFSAALNVENYIKGKKFEYANFNFPPLDTSLILNTAAAATKASMTDSAMAYYTILANAKLNAPDYIEIYQLLVDYYGKKNDAANRNKYLALGKELYPTSDYWYDIDLQPLENDKPKLIAKYEELVAANPNSYYLTYNYAVELYNYLYANENNKPADAAPYQAKLEPAILNAIKVKAGPEANLLMVRALSAQVYKLEDETRLIKGTKPEDVKKRQTMIAQTNAIWDKMAPYAQEAFNGYTAKTELKGIDKANLKFISNVLIDYYTMKKDAAKAKTYQDKLKELGI